MNRTSFGVDEWYHCFTRGVDKRKTFQTAADYKRFVEILYLSNSDLPIHRSDLHLLAHDQILQKKRGKPLVSIGAYTLLPNHFHILMQEITENGISRFMQKVGVSYAMYFNIKNNRVGNLFVKPFRSKHIDTDAYLRRVAQYIHLNTAELFESKWKKGNVKNMDNLEKKMLMYQYSSLVDYMLNEERPETSILDREARSLIADGLPPLRDVLFEANEYYKELGLTL